MSVTTVLSVTVLALPRYGKYRRCCDVITTLESRRKLKAPDLKITTIIITNRFVQRHKVVTSEAPKNMTMHTRDK